MICSRTFVFLRKSSLCLINISENEKNKLLSKQKNAENKAVQFNIEKKIPKNVPVTR